ncbi:Bro-N domain-containing protein [Paraclostridium bifermentans]|uniref:BRO-N domain-containing protein n=1 Tax=Paraclostridium bifermentans TaxID=1490 RepID=UPI00189D381E|nr:BRO family protein [Paraclostridium bifermentans]
MNNNVEKFLSEVFGEVRAINKDGEIWFVAKDICLALEYSESNVSSVVSRLDSDQKKLLQTATKGNYTTNLLCVNKYGLIEVVKYCKKISTSKKKFLLESICKFFNIDNYYLIINSKELNFLSKLEESLKAILPKINMKFQYCCCNNKYKIDCYIPSLDIAIEYDEDDHKGYTYEKQEGRQDEIEKELGCRFIRVSDKNTDEYNIGYVIKEIFDISV